MLAVLFLLFGTSACRQQTPQYSELIAIFTPASVAKQLPKAPQRQAPVETPTETQAAASFAGCYELKVGRWWPWGFGEDNSFVTPPSRIQLLSDRGTKGFEQDGYLIRAMKGSRPGRGAPSCWRVRSGDRIDLIWNDGFTGVTLDLERHGDELRGRAHPHFDSPFTRRTASVTARRIPCETPSNP